MLLSRFIFFTSSAAAGLYEFQFLLKHVTGFLHSVNINVATIEQQVLHFPFFIGFFQKFESGFFLLNSWSLLQNYFYYLIRISFAYKVVKKRDLFVPKIAISPQTLPLANFQVNSLNKILYCCFLCWL